MGLEVMIDIETLSRKANGVILSLGAVKFDPANHLQPWDNFHAAVDIVWPVGSPMGERFHIDPDTVMWWMDGARDEARARLMKMRKLDLASVLDSFHEWFGPDSLPTWGNASTFDNVMLRGSYELVGIPCPWKFWDDRCYRTMKNLPGAPPLPTHEQMAEVLGALGVAHTALYDAQRQAWHLQLIYDRLGLSRPQEVDLDKAPADLTVSELGLAIGNILRLDWGDLTKAQRDRLGELREEAARRDLVVPALAEPEFVDSRGIELAVADLDKPLPQLVIEDEPAQEHAEVMRAISGADGDEG